MKVTSLFKQTYQGTGARYHSAQLPCAWSACICNPGRHSIRACASARRTCKGEVGLFNLSLCERTVLVHYPPRPGTVHELKSSRSHSASFQTIPKNAVTRLEEAETILALPQTTWSFCADCTIKPGSLLPRFDHQCAGSGSSSTCLAFSNAPSTNYPGDARYPDLFDQCHHPES